MNYKLKKWIFTLTAVLAVATFPAVFMYCQNADEAKFSEIVPVLLTFMVIGLLAFVVLRIILRSTSKAAIVSFLFLLVFLNFSIIEDGMKILLPSLRYWHSVPLVIVIILHIAYLINRCMKEEFAEAGVKILGIVFGCLIAVNVAIAVPQIIRNWKVEWGIKKTLAQEIDQKGQLTEKNDDMPNVYLLIFDEYANFPEMEELYGYDNAPLKEFLIKHHFNISYTHHNESIWSHIVQANMVQMDYVAVDSSTTAETYAWRHTGPLFDVMREHGYDIQILERGDFYGGTMPGLSEAAVSKATTMSGESMQDILFKRTVLYPLFRKNNMQIINDYLTIVEHLCSNAQELERTFTLAYFVFPHEPFIIDERGREVGTGGYSGPEGWSNKDYYLGQFKYTTSKMMIPILESIITDDPGAIIILMSDHGARNAPGVTWELKTNSLNAVYYQGQVVEIEGLSNVNTLRTVLNNLFSLDYKMVDVPKTGDE